MMRIVYGVMVLALGLGLLSGCGKGSGSQENPTEPACSATFIDDYNMVSSAVKTVKIDVDAAYGEQAPKDPVLAKQARTKAYLSARDCRDKAVNLKNLYPGVRCTALIDDQPKAVDVNAKMDEVVKAMDMVPAP